MSNSNKKIIDSNNKKTKKRKKGFFKSNLFSFFNFKNHFNSSKEIMRKKPILKKIIYTILLIAIFRVAASITTPGVSVSSNFANDSSSFVGIMDMMGGGALKSFSIVALGISPYITASIIMTLLKSEVFPPIYRMAKSGPAGQRKLNVITRVITIVFAIIQAITIIQQLSNGVLVQLKPPFNTTVYKYFALPVILLAGSLFTLFLGEQITKKGVGSGTSLIIFSGIAVNLPSKFKNAYEGLVLGNGTQSIFVGLMKFSLYTFVFLALIFIIGYFYRAERHIPIQQTGAAMTTKNNKMSHLPIKLNPAGVMPIIFALSIAIIPLTVSQFMEKQNEVRIWIDHNLRLTQPIGLSLLALLTFLFTIAMAIVTFNPYQVADNFKKSNTFIPGIKPGEETEKYLTGVIVRLSIFSAIYLSLISSTQYIEQIIGLDQSMTLGGTSLIILVTAGIETIDQLKARDKTQKIANAKEKAKIQTGTNTGGLLW